MKRNERTLFWLLPDRFDNRQDKSSWLEMAKNLSAMGWRVQILAARSDARAHDYNGLVHYLRTIDLPMIFRWATILSGFLHLRRHADRHDLVVMNEDSLWLLPLIKATGKQHIHLDIRTIPVRLPGLKKSLDRLMFWTLPIRWFAKHADSHSFITEPLRQEFERQFGLNIAPFCIWQSGVNTDLFKPVPEAACRVREHGAGTFRLFYHGGLLHSRGIDLVLKAIPAVVREMPVQFDILGDGPARAELQQLSAALGIEQFVHFHGYHPYEEVPRFLQEAHCCICPLPDLPEWRVSSPLKVLEYVAAGKPVILTPILAHRDVASDLKSVVWITGFEPADFAAAILRARRQMEGLTRATSHSRTVICNSFEWAVQAKKLNTLFRQHLPIGPHVRESSHS